MPGFEGERWAASYGISVAICGGGRQSRVSSPISGLMSTCRIGSPYAELRCAATAIGSPHNEARWYRFMWGATFSSQVGASRLTSCQSGPFFEPKPKESGKPQLKMSGSFAAGPNFRCFSA